MDRGRILEQIRRIAAENDGKVPGREKFESETGIKPSDWYPHLWLRWSDAAKEAGFSPNKLQEAIEPEILLEKYISLVRELGHIPVDGELRRKSGTDRSFPSHSTFSKLGGKKQLLAALLQHCRTHPGLDDVLAPCKEVTAQKSEGDETRKNSRQAIKTGFVYLMKSGRHFKIGRTNSVGRREAELRIKIPVPPKTVCYIETDDPAGVESYWHARFSDKRGEGEWFDLSPEDVSAFKRWKRIV